MMIDSQFSFRSRSLSEETGDDARPLYSATDSNGTQVGNFIVSDFAIVYDFTVDEGTEYEENIFSHSLRKTCNQRKLRQTKCLLLIFWVIKFTVTPKKDIWHLAILAKLVFWSISSFKNWKVNTYFVSVFSGDRFFWGNERKYFPHILGQRHQICQLPWTIHPLDFRWSNLRRSLYIWYSGSFCRGNYHQDKKHFSVIHKKVDNTFLALLIYF
jgi:hypothetical protein